MKKNEWYNIIDEQAFKTFVYAYIKWYFTTRSPVRAPRGILKKMLHKVYKRLQPIFTQPTIVPAAMPVVEEAQKYWAKHSIIPINSRLYKVALHSDLHAEWAREAFPAHACTCAHVRGWIPVDERLPADDKRVLVYVPTLDKNKPLITTSWFVPDVSRWSLLPVVFAEAITHWMSLPADPPKETSNDLS